MKNKALGILFIILAFAILLSSCKGDAASTEDTASDTTASSNSTSDGDVRDSIPDDVDFGGETMNILCWEDCGMPEFDVESASGEHIVEDAIFYRNMEVESRLGVELNFIYTPGGVNDHDSYIAKAEQAANGHTGEYDILASYSRTIAGAALSGYAVDLLEFDVLELSAPWWSESIIKTSTVGGRLYYASGDISTNLLYMMNLVFFNTTMIGDMGLDDPYTLVEDDAWTMDKMFEMSEGLYKDLDGSYSKSVNDQYGVVLHKHHLDALFYGADLMVSEVEDGTPVLSDEFLGTPMRDFIVFMIESFHETNDNYYDNENVDVRGTFGRNRALFLVDTPIAVPKVLDNYADCIYGIVPIPKLNEEQESYRTGMRFDYTLYTLFAGSPRLDVGATVLECMASESYRRVSPAVFEITMKYQYSLDDVAAKMFDIIRSNIVYDFARDFSMELPNTPNSIYWTRIDQRDKDWISFANKSSSIMSAGLSRVVEGLAKIYGDND